MNGVNKGFLSVILGSSVMLSAVSAQATAYNPVMKKAPWATKPAIKASQTSPIYKQEWRKSDYTSCPILAIPTDSWIHPKTAKSRAANFSGGFAVAYDLSNYQGKRVRSAYGVANAGKVKVSDIYIWEDGRYLSDGSFLTSGHEGNDPNGKMLAYLVLKNGCFYNIWSGIGNDFLQNAISELRYVK